MTPQDFTDHPELHQQLSTLLDNPLLRDVLAMLERMTMAKRLTGMALTQVTNGETLLGYDVGRASVFEDLENLRHVPATPVEPRADYVDPGFKEERIEDIVRRPTQKPEPKKGRQK